MTAAQEVALRKLAEADLPIRLHASTGMVLERCGLAERRGDGFAITATGHRYLLSEERDRAARRLADEFPPNLQDRLEKTLLWLKFTGRLQRPYAARPIIQSLLLDREPFRMGFSDEQEEGRVIAEVESAVKLVDDFQTAYAKAVKIGGDVCVEIAVENPKPVRAINRKRRDVEVAANEDGTVSLTQFRNRRCVA